MNNQNNKPTSANQQNKDTESFIEIFNALEVQHLFDKAKSKDIDNSADVIYLDYIIQKHQLWLPRKLEQYKEQKENFSVEEDKWHKLLSQAQDYKVNPLWRKNYKDIETKSIDEYMDRMEKLNPDQHKWLDSLRTGEIFDHLDDEKQNNVQKLFRLIYPDSLMSDEKMKESLAKLKEKWETENWFNHVLRRVFRSEFEKEYLILSQID